MKAQTLVNVSEDALLEFEKNLNLRSDGFLVSSLPLKRTVIKAIHRVLEKS